MTFLHRHNDSPAFLLAMASAGTPVLGLRLADVQWLISVGASLIGAAVALYIHLRNDMQAAALKREAAEEEERRRQRLLNWEQSLVMREVELDTAKRAAAPPPAG